MGEQRSGRQAMNRGGATDTFLWKPYCKPQELLRCNFFTPPMFPLQGSSEYMRLIRTFMSPGRVQDTVRLREGIHMEDCLQVPRGLGSPWQEHGTSGSLHGFVLPGSAMVLCYVRRMISFN